MDSITYKPDQIPVTSTMWPSKPGLGVQLTYGITGNGLVVAEKEGSGQRPKISFPRLRDVGIELHPVMNSAIWLRPLQPSDSPEVDSIKWWARHLHNTVDAPTNLIRSLYIESEAVLGSQAFDPCVGNLATVFDLGSGAYSDRVVLYGNKTFFPETNNDPKIRDNKRMLYPKLKNGVVSVQALAYAGGDNGNTLHVMALIPKKKQLFGAEIQKVVAVNSSSTTTQAVCCFHEPIKQIVANTALSVLAIRTATGIRFIHYSWSNRPIKKIHLRRLPVEIKTADNGPFAHLEFNPYKKNEFALINTAGEFVIWNISRTADWKLEKQTTDLECPETGVDIPLTVADPLNTSKWHKLTWIDESTVLAFSRTAASYFNLATSAADRIITAHRWSKIQDVVPTNRYTFMLTTQEIVWTENSPDAGMKRLVSWKHYLGEDPSLRMNVCSAEDNKAFLCVVYSLEASIIIIYTFGFNNGLPCSLRDPYFLRAQSPSGLRHVSLTRLPCSGNAEKALFSLIEICKDNSVTLSVVHGTADRAFKKTRIPKHKPHMIGTLFEVIALSEAMKMYEYFSSDRKLPGENNNIFVPRSKSGKITIREKRLKEIQRQLDMIQKFAFILGEQGEAHFRPDNDNHELPAVPKPEYPQYLSLSGIAEETPLLIKDMSAFDSMVKQLNIYFNTMGVEIENYIKPVLSRCGDELDDPSHFWTAQTLVNMLAKTCDKPTLEQAIMILVNALTKVGPTDVVEEYQMKFEAEVEQCPDKTKSLLADWDDQEEPENECLIRRPFQQKNRTLLRQALTQNSQYAYSQLSPEIDPELLTQGVLLGGNYTQSQDIFQGASQPTQSLEPSQVMASQQPPQVFPSQQPSQVFPSQRRIRATQPSQALQLLSTQASQASQLPSISLSPPIISQSKRAGPPLSQKRKKKKKGGFA